MTENLTVNRIESPCSVSTDCFLWRHDVGRGICLQSRIQDGLGSKAMKQLIAAVAFFLVSSAQAGTITGFTGEYDVSNWTTTFTSPCNGCATIASATELTLVGADGAEAFDQFTDRTITVLTNAIITFSWEYETFDAPFWGLFGIIYNDGSGILFTPLSDETGAAPQSGSL